MKPRIRLLCDGWWSCLDMLTGCIGAGNSPDEAYRNWASIALYTHA